MTTHEIEITVHPGGQIETEIKGVKGTACKLISQWLAKLGKVLKHRDTAEIYEKEKTDVRERNKR